MGKWGGLGSGVGVGGGIKMLSIKKKGGGVGWKAGHRRGNMNLGRLILRPSHSCKYVYEYEA